LPRSGQPSFLEDAKGYEKKKKIEHASYRSQKDRVDNFQTEEAVVDQ